METPKTIAIPAWKFLLITIGVLLLALGWMFRDAFDSSKVVFANDAPLGAIQGYSFGERVDGWGFWQDLNWVGGVMPSATPNFTKAFLETCLLIGGERGPVYFAKFYAPTCLFLLGLSAWLFFRSAGFAAPVGVVAAMAAALNGDFFTYACWGLPSVALAAAGAFFGLAAVLQGLRGRVGWMLILAGVSVGVGVMEAYDVGALFSLLVATATVFAFWNRENSKISHVIYGSGAVVMIALVAALTAGHAISGLLKTQVEGVAIMQKSEENRNARWEFATQWSLPKSELLRVAVPGLFGYRLDTTGGGVYWGSVGQSQGWEPGQPGLPRHSGYGVHTGTLVWLLALCALIGAFKGGLYSAVERRWIIFWAVIAGASILFALGKNAPFYQLIFPLPFFSSMRNPIKFMHVFSFAMVILFAFGLEGVFRFVSMEQKRLSDLASIWKKFAWAAVGASFFFVLVWIMSVGDLRAFLTKRAGIDPETAKSIISFSNGELLWFIAAVLIAVLLFTRIVSRTLCDGRPILACVFLGGLLAVDLAKGNASYLVCYDYRYKYKSNDVIDFLGEKPHEQRVAMLPFGTESSSTMRALYDVEWTQHLFQYYRIQSLDIIQEPRSAEDNAIYRATFRSDIRAMTRLWELTGTRYLIGPGMGFTDALNKQMDPQLNRFKERLTFALSEKGGREAKAYEDLTVKLSTNGPLALIEFAGALPRAMLFAQYESGVGDAEALKRLVSAEFVPNQRVILSERISAAPNLNSATNAASGKVSFVSYDARRIVLKTESAEPAILLLNDKHHPDWNVTVDGRKEKLLRANFLMRAVQVPAGEHKVEFRFEPANPSLNFSFAGLSLGAIALAGAVWPRRKIAS